jgi:hypothetical protein
MAHNNFFIAHSSQNFFIAVDILLNVTFSIILEPCSNLLSFDILLHAIVHSTMHIREKIFQAAQWTSCSFFPLHDRACASEWSLFGFGN